MAFWLPGVPGLGIPGLGILGLGIPGPRVRSPGQGLQARQGLGGARASGRRGRPGYPTMPIGVAYHHYPTPTHPDPGTPPTMPGSSTLRCIEPGLITLQPGLCNDSFTKARAKSGLGFGGPVHFRALDISQAWMSGWQEPPRPFRAGPGRRVTGRPWNINRTVLLAFRPGSSSRRDYCSQQTEMDYPPGGLSQALMFEARRPCQAFRPARQGRS